MANPTEKTLRKLYVTYVIVDGALSHKAVTRHVMHSDGVFAGQLMISPPINTQAAAVASSEQSTVEALWAAHEIAAEAI